MPATTATTTTSTSPDTPCGHQGIPIIGIVAIQSALNNEYLCVLPTTPPTLGLTATQSSASQFNVAAYSGTTTQMCIAAANLTSPYEIVEASSDNTAVVLVQSSTFPPSSGTEWQISSATSDVYQLSVISDQPTCYVMAVGDTGLCLQQSATGNPPAQSWLLDQQNIASS